MELDLKEFLSKDKWNIELGSVPVRVWTKQRGLPLEIKIGEYKTTVRNNNGELVPVVRNAIWGKMETIESYEKRKRNKTSNRWCKGSGTSSRRSFECKKENEFVWIKLVSKWKFGKGNNRGMFFDGEYLRLELKQNELGFWCISGEGQIRCLILPRKILLEDDLFEFIGILDGEMCKKLNKIGGTAFKITNTEPLIIKHIIDSLRKYFRIQKEDLEASITVNARNRNPRKDMIVRLKEFWVTKTGILLSKITKTTVNKKLISKFSPYGVIQIRYSNDLFFNVLMNFLKNIRSVILENERYVIPYLRGLVAAEGGIGKHPNGALRMILIGGTKPSDQEFYCNCLDKIGINGFRTYDSRIEIYNTSNFLKLYHIDLFGLHPRRKREFIVALGGIRKLKHHPFSTPTGSTRATLSDIPDPWVVPTTDSISL